MHAHTCQQCIFRPFNKSTFITVCFKKQTKIFHMLIRHMDFKHHPLIGRFQLTSHSSDRVNAKLSLERYWWQWRATVRWLNTVATRTALPEGGPRCKPFWCFDNCERHACKATTQISINRESWRERRAEAESNCGSSIYFNQPSACLTARPNWLFGRVTRHKTVRKNQEF